MVFSIAAVFAVFALLVALVYQLLTPLKFSEFATAILSGIGGLSLLCLSVALLSYIRVKRFNHLHRSFAHETILKALGEIAQGNFDVILTENEGDPFNELVQAFNEMAKNLGSLETMRQNFISDVSHEIQSPLTSIKGFAALLRSDKITDEERRHYTEIIESESRRLSAMSENLLKLSALDSGSNPLNLTGFRLDKQLQNVALALEPQWSAKNIVIDIDAEKTAITADEDLLAQVWMNLLGNAIKFTPCGGSVSIALRDNTVIMQDTGIGIAESDLARIFERFYKADKARDRAQVGNGLGLSIAKKILDLHGFAIAAESKLEEGTRFTVRLHCI
jgi:signal transduction histidine kinase